MSAGDQGRRNRQLNTGPYRPGKFNRVWGKGCLRASDACGPSSILGTLTSSKGENMSQYTTNDFEESIRIVGLERKDIKRVLAAWGNVDSEGACCEACGGEWTGGFVMELKDGHFATLTGWCDYTGWGCQDGANLEYDEIMPKLTPAALNASAIDPDPADLNRFIAG